MQYFNTSLSPYFNISFMIFKFNAILENPFNNFHETLRGFNVTALSWQSARMSFVWHSYVLVCQSYVTRIYPYVTRMYSLYHSHVTRMYTYVNRMSLVYVFTMNLTITPNSVKFVKPTSLMILKDIVTPSCLIKIWYHTLWITFRL